MNIRDLADIIERGERGEQLQIRAETLEWVNRTPSQIAGYMLAYLLAGNIRIKPREYWAFVPSGNESARWGSRESALFKSREEALKRYSHVEGRAVRMVDAP